MKWILAACLFVATYAVVPVPSLNKAYEAGWQYTYEYESQVLTGVPTATDQFSGFKVKGEVVLQFSEQSGHLKTVLKMDKVVIFKVHSNLGGKVLPSESLPEQLLEVITNTPEGEILVKQLTKQCSFAFKNGDIEDLKVDENEPHWSINFKKGIVNLLKVNLKVNNLHYTVTEDGVLGRCDSQYTINSMHPFVKVNKVRHLASCTEKSIVEVGLFSGIPETEQKLLQPTMHTDYVLYTDKQRFAIKQVEAKSTYIVSPTQKTTDSLVTYTNQRMVLSELHEIRTHLNADNLSKVEQSLLYVVPNPLINVKYNHKTFQTDKTSQNENQLTIVDQLLTTIVRKMRTPFIEDSVPSDLIKINQMLPHLSSRDILTLVRKYSCDDEVCYMKLQILLDCVPSLPSDAASQVVITLVKEKMVTGFRASLMINTLALTANPTPALIDQCMQLYKVMTSTTTTQDKMVTRSLMLCVGTLANRMINMHQKMGIDRQATKPIQRGIVNELRAMVRSATTTEEKLRLIKTMGNFGEVSLLPELKTIIEDKTQPWQLREVAIVALRKFVDVVEVKDQIMNIALPIFLDTTEKTCTRSSAFLILIRSQPEYRTFELIAHKMETEPCHQIKTLVYTVFLNIAQTQTVNLRFKNMTMNARRSLKFMTPVEVMPWDTQMMHTDLYSEMSKIGVSFDGYLLKSHHSLLPSSLVTFFKGTMFGKYLTFFDAGVHTIGLEKLVQRIIDWFMKEGDLSSILNILSNTQEDIHGSYISEQINNILSKLPVDEMDDIEFMAMAQFKINTQEMQYISINKEDIVDLFSTQNLNTILKVLFEGKDFRWTKVVSFVENSLVVPTPAGVPVYLNFTAIHVQSFVGHFKLEGLESLIGSIISGGRFSFDSLKLKLKADLSTPTDVILKMGSSLNTLHTGAATKFQVHANIPIDVEASFEKSTGKLMIKNKIPDEKVELLKVIVEPYTFFAKTLKMETVVEKLPLSNPSTEELVTREYSLPLLVLPVSVDVESKLRLGSPRWSAIFPLVGKQEIYVTLNKKSVRCPNVLLEIDLTELPNVIKCNEKIRSDWYTTESDLVVVHPDEAFVKKCPAVIIPMEITTEDNSARRIQMQTTYIRSPNWMIHQHNFQIVAKSLYGLPVGFENIKLFTETFVNIQNMIEGNSRYPIGKFTMGFGANKFDENKAVVKVVEGAPEHIFEEKYSTPSHDNTETFKYTVDIEYTQITDEVRSIVDVCKYYLQPLYIQYLTKLNVPSSVTDKNEIKCFLKVVPEWEKLFVVFDLPTGQRYRMKLPWTVPYLRPLALHHPYSLMVTPQHLKMNNIQKFSSFGKCVLAKTTLKTFDGHTVNLPKVFFDPNCEQLISRDCSSKKSFMLTMKPTDRSGQKAIKLLVPEYKIEVVPASNNHWFSLSKQVALKIKINDKDVPLKTHEPLVLESKLTSRRNALYVIEKENQVINITCIDTGLSVFFDGIVVRVEAKPHVFQGRVCGLCADFNFDSSDDVTTTHVTKQEALKKFFFKNIIPSTECHPQGF
ncbi:hypothetical protein CAPTEDRAFT_198189 [Capitella teleta]|uniref:Vitellogenin domain-containing protein n=1 Tax=Capitella teleta TaxID=283909 RepID=X1ZYD0_CAPTE|nr:hypothetical protein CAPTEDRAFT_198189 [Capitella teleta]|eukprot:ELU04729.1 hypothetical protein CAPTEDRAFT_198189 [Capitella teleta]